MWTFDDFPAGRVERSLGVRLGRDWLDRVRGASVRLTTGCSASLVSRDGLALTNHHCVMACEQSLSSPTAHYIDEGFLTDARPDERQCPGMQAEILTGITDVTGPIFAASSGKVGADYVNAREGAIFSAERAACGADPRLRCQVIAFFGGGLFKLYKYRTYPDVRLVFAPEFAAAFFGGDEDNFNFPRFDLDCAFLRLYEGGRPALTPGFLTWSAPPPKAGEAVFTSGSPGATERSFTVAQLETQRDIAIPIGEAQRSDLRGRLTLFADESPDHRRIATDSIFAQDNALQVLRGRARTLRDPAFMSARRAEEARLKARLAVDPALAAQIGDPWAEIAQAQKAYGEQYIVWRQLESGAGGGAQLFGYARALVRAALERPKPSARRLPEFADSRLALLRKTLFDDKPAPPELDTLFLVFWFSKTRESLGADSPATLAFLEGQSSEALARRLIQGSRLADPARRRALWDGGLAAIQASDDALIRYVLATDPYSRAARELWEDEVEGPVDRASERIARLRVAVLGRSLYPDATFSPRLSYGQVAGWEDGASHIAPFTTFSGLYARATGSAPFALPPRWLAAKSALAPDTVLNFVTTNDITGGNSGSPVVNAKAEIVGTAFDGNRPSIAGDYAYDGAVNRTVVVATGAIGEALDKVYGRAALVRELKGRKGPPPIQNPHDGDRR
ncbi:MAG: S46 family peptidase [Caulobacteraceae bacterium]|nr:S46 family peptidase [Caulobacteraceae bacterium]